MVQSLGLLVSSSKPKCRDAARVKALLGNSEKPLGRGMVGGPGVEGKRQARAEGRDENGKES